VVPHKNSSGLLSRLLDSIPKAPGIEVIVVDDKSSPHEVEALRKIAIPENWKLLFLDNPGYAGRARNVGLGVARGDWVVFADSDDFFTSSLCDSITPFLDRRDLDVVYFNVSSVDCAGNTSYRHIPYSDLVQKHLSAVSPDSHIRYRHTPPWGKLFRRDFLAEIGASFDEIPASNDIYFSVRTGHLARQIAACADVIYIVTQRSGSITNTVSVGNLESKFQAALKVNAFLRQVGRRQFQHSILYFLFRAWTLQKPLALQMLLRSISNGNNPLTGLYKVTDLVETIRKRESR